MDFRCTKPPPSVNLQLLKPHKNGTISHLSPVSSNKSIDFQMIRDQCKLGFRNIQHAIKLFDEMLPRTPPLSIISYNQLFTAIAKMKCYSTVPPLYKQMIMSTSKIQPDLCTFNILIDCFCHSNQSKSSYSVLAQIYRSGYLPNIVNLTTFLNGLCIDGKVPEALDLFRKMQRMGYPCNVFLYGVIINGFCKNGMLHKALELLDEFEDEEDMSVMLISDNDAALYSPIIDGLCKQGLVDDGVKVLVRMKKKGIRPNVITYNILIDAFCKLGMIEKAHEVLGVMIRQRETPNAIIYNTLIHGYCSIGKMKNAVKVFKTMVGNNCEPDIVTYSTLINGFCKFTCPNERTQLFDQPKVHDNGSSEWMNRTNELLASMIRKGKKPNTITYNTLIYGYCSVGKMKNALRIFNAMVSTDCEPDTVTYSTLIDGFCKSPVEAQQIFDGMQIQSKGSSDFKNRKLLDGLYKNESLGIAIKLFHLSEEKGVAPTIVTYTTLIMGFIRVGQINHARELFNQISANGLKPNVITYSAMIHGYCKEGMMDEASKLLITMEEDGCAPDEITFKTLVDAHLRKNNEYEARQLMDKMTERGFL